jgi:hypothetical protein
MQSTKTHRRVVELVAVAGAALLASVGFAAIAPSAGAVTTAVTPTSLDPFETVSHVCADASTASPTTQSFVAGPGTPPSGKGSLKFTFGATDHTDELVTDAYDGAPLAMIENLQYSTYVETAGKTPPYLRLSVDNENDGTTDNVLLFFPGDNSAQHAAANGAWQTWDVDSGTLRVDTPGGATTTLAAWIATPGNEDAVISPSTAGTGPASGGFALGQGCDGPESQNSTTNADLIVVKLTDTAIDKFDLEATAPARSFSISPSSGKPGDKITANGTDCYEPSATIILGASQGESGGPVDQVTVTPAADGTFTGTLTIPPNSNPDANYSVLGSCGPDADPAFQYETQAFDVAGPTGASGYRMVAADGGVFTFGDRVFHGSTGNMVLNKPIVGGATDTSTFDGYWMVASDGGVFTFNAPFFGSLGNEKLASPATEIEPTPTGKGYWIVLANGTVHPFGDAKHYGDMSGKALNKPMIGMSVTPTGKGYWLVGEDGGIFNFGDAGFFGSTGDKKLNAPVIDLAPAVDNNGYYLLAKDGGVFTFGSAVFKGSTGDMKLNAPVIAMLVAPNGAGYWLAATDGGIFTFGAVDFLGSMGNKKLNSPVLDLIN